MSKYKVNKKISRKRKLYKIKIFFIFIFSPFIIFIIALVFLFNQKAFLIKNIKITGDDFLDKQKIEEIIDNNMKGRNRFFISNKNFIFYPESKIKKQLVQKFIEIKDVDIFYENLLNYKNIEVRIKQKDKKYLWCKTSEYKECRFVLNNSDVADIFDPKKTNKNKNEFVVILGEVSEEINKETNKKRLKFFKTKDDFIEFEKSIDKFINAGLKIKDVRRIKNDDYVIKTNNDVKVIISKEFSRDNLDNFMKVSRYKDISFDSQTGLFSDNLEYINLTFGKTIVYCLKGDECVGNY